MHSECDLFVGAHISQGGLRGECLKRTNHSRAVDFVFIAAKDSAKGQHVHDRRHTGTERDAFLSSTCGTLSTGHVGGTGILIVIKHYRSRIGYKYLEVIFTIRVAVSY